MAVQAPTDISWQSRPKECIMVADRMDVIMHGGEEEVKDAPRQ
jgi:hypothetical protein